MTLHTPRLILLELDESELNSMLIIFNHLQADNLLPAGLNSTHERLRQHAAVNHHTTTPCPSRTFTESPPPTLSSERFHTCFSTRTHTPANESARDVSLVPSSLDELLDDMPEECADDNDYLPLCDLGLQSSSPTSERSHEAALTQEDNGRTSKKRKALVASGNQDCSSSENGPPAGTGWASTCNRGGARPKVNSTRAKERKKRSWKLSPVPVAPTIEMQNAILLLIDKVASDPRCTISHSMSKSWIQGMKNAIIGVDNSYRNDLYHSNDLLDLTKRCLAAEQKHCFVGLVQVVSWIELACKVDSIQRYAVKHGEGDISVEDIYDYYKLKDQITYMTFSRWVSEGAKFTCLAGGGTIYFLMIIVALTAKTDYRRLDSVLVVAIANLLRQPHVARKDIAHLIQYRIIPMINYLRKEIPIRLQSHFHSAVVLGDIGDLNSHTIQQSDALFDELRRNTFKLLPRDSNCWAGYNISDDNEVPYSLTRGSQYALSLPSTCDDVSTPFTRPLLPHVSSTPWTSIPSKPTPNVSQAPVTILTFRMGARAHERPPFPRRAAKDNERLACDDKEREKAAHAQRYATFEEFIVQHQQSMNKKGIRKKDSPYHYYPNNWIHLNHRRLNDCDNNLTAFVTGQLPLGVRDRLLISLKSCFSQTHGDILVERDSASVSGPPTFSSLHFTYYIRSGTKGHTAPDNVNPMFLRTEGASRTNFYQFTPRVSTECRENWGAFEHLSHSFAEAFEFVAANLKSEVPEYFEDIVIYADVLPNKDISPAYPFSGFVINFNVVTRLHRDSKDHRGCAVLVIGDFEGGELCLYEPGIVFELKNGDLIVFPSGKISHFNLHYRGIRASMVLHSDKSGVGYKLDKNGWSKSIH